jgi:hypothetical protein
MAKTSISAARKKLLRMYGVETSRNLEGLTDDQWNAMLDEAKETFAENNAIEAVDVPHPSLVQKWKQNEDDAEQRQDKLPPAIDFAPYFDWNHPLPAPRSTGPGSKGYCLGLPMEDYRAFPGVNASLLANATPREMLHDMLQPEEEGVSEAMTLGTLLHWAALEPWKFDAEHRDDHMMLCATEGINTKGAKAQREANPGKLLVTPKLVLAAHQCREALTHPKAMQYLGQDVLREVSGFVWDGPNNVWRKGRYDLLPTKGNWIGDLKTTRRPLGQFEKDVKEYRYAEQAAWYLDLHFLLCGERKERFVWIVVTNHEPFMFRVFCMGNRKPTDPFYNPPNGKPSSICNARQRLGLDDSGRLARLPMFVNAAQQTIALKESGANLTPKLLQGIWEGYENETPEEIEIL